MITIKLRVNWFVFKCFSVRWLIFYNENVRTRAGQTIALEQIRITVSCDFFFCTAIDHVFVRDDGRAELGTGQSPLLPKDHVPIDS